MKQGNFQVPAVFMFCFSFRRGGVELMIADAMLDHQKNWICIWNDVQLGIWSQIPEAITCSVYSHYLVTILHLFMPLFTVLHSYTIRRSLTLSLVWDADGIMKHLAISRHWDEVLKNCQDLLDRRYEINRWLWREATRCYASNSSNNSNNKNKQHKEGGCSIERKSIFIAGILV